MFMVYQSVNPATGETVAQFPSLTEPELETKLITARQAFLEYRTMPIRERAALLEKAACILEDEKLAFGKLMTREMGKTLVSATAEAEKCAWVCRHYALDGARLLADECVNTGSTKSYVRYMPLGPILAIMPWNYPFWQVFRFAAPVLIAGNVGLLKHARSVPECALAIEDVFRRAGFKEGVFQSLFISIAQMDRLYSDDRVVAFTVTGSEKAGGAVASRAGQEIKKTVLELGGSDPFIVLKSANVAEAAATAVRARTVNNGQSCIAAKRFIVEKDVYAEFTRRFLAGMESLKVGDPLDPSTQIGPLATRSALLLLQGQVARAIDAGARLLTGGLALPRAGNYYMPTVLEDVPRDCKVYHEELFGPAAMLFEARDRAHAIELANDSPFGLAASVWTQDEADKEVMATQVEAGAVFFNEMVASDPRLPFGGIKRSGYGRELGTWGAREFVNVKTIVER